MTPDDTTIQFFVIWALALTTLMNFLTNVWTIFSGPSKRNAEALADLGKTLQRLETRLQSVEVKQSSQPTSEAIHKMELSMENMRGEMSRISEAMNGQAQIMGRMESMIARHEDHLLDGSRK